MEEKRDRIFIVNEEKVNSILTKVILFVCMLFPLLALARRPLSYTALEYADDLVLGGGGLLLVIISLIWQKRKMMLSVVKYFLLLGVHLGVCYAGTKIEINIYMLYIVVPAISCLYFNRWFTIRIGEICYSLMLLSLGLRSAVEAEQESSQYSAFEWFGAYGFRMTIEYIVMLVILLMLVIKIEDTIQATQAKNRQMKKMQNQLITGFANFLESKDENTGFHIRRTADYAKMIAQELVRSGEHLDELTPKAIDDLIIAAPLHDAGKVYIPDSILQKSSGLTAEEYETIKSHTVEGGRLIEMNLSNLTDRELYTCIKDVALCHHEWWNGTGYPHGYHGEAIPLSARIVAAADTLDALLSQRSYKPSMDIEQVMDVFRNEKGIHFEPCIATAVLNLQGDIKRYIERENIKMKNMNSGETEEFI